MLHHGANSLPLWFLECIGLYVCLMNRCGYCVSHHCQGMLRLIGDDARAESIRRDLERGNVTDGFNERQAAALRYAEVLTRSPADVAESHIQVMRDAGYGDGEILEINQVASYFAYANRMVLGLGVTTDGDILGLSPSGDADDWGHR